MSNSQKVTKITAIMFTDIAGYTTLSAKILQILRTSKDPKRVTKPIEKHGGSWMKEMGDGLLNL